MKAKTYIFFFAILVLRGEGPPLKRLQTAGLLLAERAASPTEEAGTWST